MIKLVFFLVASFLLPPLNAQVSLESFKREFKRPDEQLLARIQQSITVPVLTDDFARIYADQVSFDVEDNLIKALGKAVIIYKDLVIQADQVFYDKQTGDLFLVGNSKIARGLSFFEADEIDYNLKTQKGAFRNGKSFLLNSFFSFSSESGAFNEISEFDLKNVTFSSCRCEDGSLPWSFKASNCSFKRKETLSAKNVWFEVNKIPIFYLPYLRVPVHESRKAGFLAPKIGYSQRHGLSVEAPLFIPPDQHSELMLTPFVQTKTRAGLKLDYKRLFREKAFVESTVVYSNEELRKRNGVFETRGTNARLYSDPNIDANRVGAKIRAFMPVFNSEDFRTQFFVDIRRTSDDLMVKEIPTGIAHYSTPFLLSGGNLRTTTRQFGVLNVGFQSVQDFGRAKDRIFDELPSVSHVYARSLGFFQTKGLRLTPKFQLNTDFINYSREELYEGSRFNITPALTSKIGYKNFFALDSKLFNSFKFYNSSNTLEESFDENLFTTRLDVSASTSFERVYDFRANVFDKNDIREKQTRGLKHVLQPFLGAIYQNNSKDPQRVPNFNPLIDRTHDLEALRYGISTTFFLSYEPTQAVNLDFSEFLPSLQDYLSSAKESPYYDDFRNVKKVASKHRFLNLTISELYNLESAFENTGSRFSNTSLKGTLRILENFDLKSSLSFDRSDQEFQFLRVGSKTSLPSSTLYLDYLFKNLLDDDLNQIITGFKSDLRSNLAFGLWGRLDMESLKLQDAQSIFQFSGSCNCWFVDLGLEKKQNPDDLKFTVTLVLSGLGDIIRDLPINFRQRQVSNSSDLSQK